MLEMKAYYCMNDPIDKSEIYITNSPAIRKLLNEAGIQYQGWVLEDGLTFKESKAPTLKISSERAIRESLLVNPEITAELSVGVSEEKINEVINLLCNEKYKLFVVYDQFIRLEKFNKLPGRMLTFLISVSMLWILWSLLFGK